MKVIKEGGHRLFEEDQETTRYVREMLDDLGKPDDVAGAVLYLALPIANMVMGHVLMVDAGWTAH